MGLYTLKYLNFFATFASFARVDAVSGIIGWKTKSRPVDADRGGFFVIG